MQPQKCTALFRTPQLLFFLPRTKARARFLWSALGPQHVDAGSLGSPVVAFVGKYIVAIQKGCPHFEDIGLWMDEIHFAPPQKPWKDDSPVNTNKQWFPTVSKWCRISSIHSTMFLQTATCVLKLGVRIHTCTSQPAAWQ